MMNKSHAAVGTCMNARMNTRTNTRARSRAQQRGIAVILALIAVSVATLLGLSLATSRDATVATSSNLSKVATARAAAASGIDLASAMLLKADALASLNDATLFNGVSINGANVRAEVRDIETGRPATNESSAIEIIVHAEADGLVQIARAVGRAPMLDAPMRADLDCSEFALLGTSTIALLGDAHVSVWNKSPLAVLGEPVRYGLSSGSSTGLNIGRAATLHGCVELRQDSFTQGKEEFEQALATKLCPIPAAIHVPDGPRPERPEGVDAVASLMLDGLVAQSAASSGDARVPARGSATMRGAITIDIGGNFFVERGARMFVEGATVVVVRGNTVIDAGTVEVGQTGSLTIIAIGDLSIDGAFVGGARSDPSEIRDASGQANYDGGASRVMIFSSDQGRVLIADGSVVKGQIYAPQARVDVESLSAVYGRILGKEIVLHEGVALYYDPTLDGRLGWSNAESGIWTESGTVVTAVREVAKLDDTSLLDFAAKTGLEPEPSSIAEASVVIQTQTIRDANFDDRLEQVSSESTKNIRMRMKSRLLQRLEELKREHLESALKSVEGSGSGFVSLGFQSVKGEDD